MLAITLMISSVRNTRIISFKEFLGRPESGNVSFMKAMEAIQATPARKTVMKATSLLSNREKLQELPRHI